MAARPRRRSDGARQIEPPEPGEPAERSENIANAATIRALVPSEAPSAAQGYATSCGPGGHQVIHTAPSCARSVGCGMTT